MGRGRSKAGGGGSRGADKESTLVTLDKEAQLQALREQLENTGGRFAKHRIQNQIDMLEADFEGTLQEWNEIKAKEREEAKAKAIEEANRKKAEAERAEQVKRQAQAEQLQREMETQPTQKVEQFKIIQETNPMQDDYHVGIRKPSDIKTWSEAMQDDESFAWGDFTMADAQKALRTGKITVYSSYPIKNGVFVSTSKVQSEQYAGGSGNKIYQKTVSLDDVAWINGDEGQFAVVKRSRGRK